MPTKDPAKKKAQLLRWKENNPGRMYELQKAWREKNKERIRERANELSKQSRERGLAIMRGNPSDTRHGSLTGYVYGCRCEQCTRANREKSRARSRPSWEETKKRMKPLSVDDERHGTTGGYTNHGCRCDLCKAAAAERMQKYRAARKEVRDEVMGK